MKKNKDVKYTGFITEIKQRIVQSRYQAARLANRELLLLYLYVGKSISEKIEAEKWGAKVLEQMSDDLQSELPRLRGFSYRNLMKRKQFSEKYLNILSFLPLPTAEMKNRTIKSTGKPTRKNQIIQSATAQLKKRQRFCCPLSIKQAPKRYENFMKRRTSALYCR